MHLTIGKVKLCGYKYFLLVKFIFHVNDPMFEVGGSHAIFSCYSLGEAIGSTAGKLSMTPLYRNFD